MCEPGKTRLESIQGKRAAVFLDRDGTIIADDNYLSEPAQVRLLPGAAEAIRCLRAAGYLIIVVSNQSGIARGLFTEERLAEINRRMEALLAAEGAHLDAIYYCPHLPEGTVAKYARECDCRKPAPGLLLRAAREHNIDLSRSWIIGDAERDVEAGRRAGLTSRTILLAERRPPQTVAGAIAPSLTAAAEIVLQELQDC